MPFTPAHPAILLPAHILPRRYVSWTALIIGSMVPDMEYFMFMNPGSRMSHTLYGIANFNLPVTILLAMAWHQFAGSVLLRAFPFTRKMYTTIHKDYAGWLAKNWLVFLISAMVGICSHLFIDGFCHHTGFMVQRLPYLQEMVTVAGFTIRRCYLVWYVASAIGLVLMFFAAINLNNLFSKEKWHQVFRMRGFFMRVIVVALLISGTRILMGLSWNVIRHLVVITMGALFYSVILVTMYEKFRRKT
jgi:hypothetical protein